MTSADPTFRHHSRLAPLFETSVSGAFLEVGAGAILDLEIRFWLGQFVFKRTSAIVTARVASPAVSRTDRIRAAA
jgi:hypothetical protein